MKICAAIAVVLCLGVAGCDDGEPIVLTSMRVPSPDGKSVAIVEAVDNGLGFGQGMVYDEVHVGPSDLRTVGHGNYDVYVVFYAAQEASPSGSLRVSWLDPDHVRIEYDPSLRPARSVQSIGHIQVVYVPRAAS